MLVTSGIRVLHKKLISLLLLNRIGNKFPRLDYTENFLRDNIEDNDKIILKEFIWMELKRRKHGSS